MAVVVREGKRSEPLGQRPSGVAASESELDTVGLPLVPSVKVSVLRAQRSDLNHVLYLQRSLGSQETVSMCCVADNPFCQSSFP